MENQEITIKLTVEKWNVVMGALGKMPFEQVVGVVNEIKAQADPQLAANAASGQTPQ